MKKIKVLHVVSALHTGGVERLLLNYYSNMDRNLFHFDFVVHRDDVGILENYFIGMDSKVYHIPSLRESFTKNLSEFIKLILNNQYDFIHFHLGYYSSFAAIAAKVYQPKAKIIIHSHIAYEPLNLLSKVIKIILSKIDNLISDISCACSYDAGVYQFGKRAMASEKVNIVYNAININSYLYNEDLRKTIRSELNLDKKIVFGNIGRLTDQKNQAFLLDVFKKIHDSFPNTSLLLIGAGEDEAKLKKTLSKFCIENDVLFLGAKMDAEAYYNCFDLFLLPSKYEGLGMTLIEAQVNGLPCISSKHVPEEVNITGTIEFLPLDEDFWIERIIQLIENNSIKRNDNSDSVAASRYNALNEVHFLEKLYQSN